MYVCYMSASEILGWNGDGELNIAKIMPQKVENFAAQSSVQNNVRFAVELPPPQPLYHRPRLKFMCISLHAKLCKPSLKPQEEKTLAEFPAPERA